MVKLGRYYVGPNWVQVKVDARVPMPDTLNLETYRGRGIQDGEMPMPDEVSSSGTPAGSASGAIEPDMEIVAQLISMGFSENGCKRATIATQNSGAEAAMNWVFEHMEDSNFNEPLPAVEESAGADAGPPAEMVDMICAMGYTPEQAKGALKATDNNIERAMDWIFSHMDDLDAAVRAANSASEGGGGGAGGDASSESPLDDGEGVYSLLAIVSHIGRNTDHGHYVCHIKKESGWVVYNDDKVAKSKSPPVEYGFMYLYRRVDGSGSLQ
jgi:ubiquitin carboxyl-terminal hydrolase 5/13